MMSLALVFSIRPPKLCIKKLLTLQTLTHPLWNVLSFNPLLFLRRRRFSCLRRTWWDVDNEDVRRWKSRAGSRGRMVIKLTICDAYRPRPAFIIDPFSRFGPMHQCYSEFESVPAPRKKKKKIPRFEAACRAINLTAIRVLLVFMYSSI